MNLIAPMRKIIFFLMLCASTAQAACEMQPTTIVGKTLIGSFETKRLKSDAIKFSPETGDITGKNAVFDFDTLYEMDSGKSSARFRVGEAFLIDGVSYVGNVEWESGKAPKKTGIYEFYALKTEPVKNAKTLTMVGDSITWWSYGRYFRCLLAPELPGVQFVGPHTDVVGYGHAGEGGNNTQQVIDRLDKIKPSNYYFVLAGTNDWNFWAPPKTIENLKEIAKALNKKGGQVIISTLLPRLDEHDAHNEEVNRLLLAWNGEGCDCKIIDLGSEFRKLPNSQSYFWDNAVHPNFEGYQKITEILGTDIRKTFNQVAQ